MCLIYCTWVVGALCMPSHCIFCISPQNHLFTYPYPFMNCKLTKTLIPTTCILQLINYYLLLWMSGKERQLPSLTHSSLEHTHSLAMYLVVQHGMYFPASFITKCGYEVWVEGCVQLLVISTRTLVLDSLCISYWWLGKSEDWHYTCKPHVDVGRNTSLGIYAPLQTVIQERNKLCLLSESNKS